MGIRINNNVMSLTAQRYLGANNNAMSLSLEKLSSGMRINRAADNPAGLVTSEQQRAQIAGLNQAIENSERGISMVQTAEAALNEVNTLLTKVRGLTLDSANSAVNDANSLAANQREITEALASIDRIATNTQFGSKRLLDGSNMNSVSVTDGSDSLHMTFANSTLSTGTDTVTVTNFQAASYSVANAATVGISASPSVHGLEGVRAGDHTVEVTQASDYATLTGNVDLDAAAFALATGDTISVSVDGGAAVDLTILVGDNGADTQAAWVAAINNAITEQGVEGIAAVAGDNGTIEFVSGNVAGNAYNTGSDHSVTVTGINVADAGVTTLDDIGFEAGNRTAAGTDAIVEFDGHANTVAGTGLAGDTAIVLEDASGNKVSVQAGATGLSEGTAILTVTAATGDIALAGVAAKAFMAGQTVELADANGNTVEVTIGEGITTGGSEAITAINNALVFQIGSNQHQTVSIGLDDISSTNLARGVTNSSGFASLKDIDVTSATGAQSALALIDDAITEISSMRGVLGSFQANTLESNLSNLRIASENLTAAESTIRDTDFASEMSNFTKNQILVQAGMTVLSNANQMPQQVLSLLR